jgi:hypothetical protein
VTPRIFSDLHSVSICCMIPEHEVGRICFEERDFWDTLLTLLNRYDVIDPMIAVECDLALFGQNKLFSLPPPI